MSDNIDMAQDDSNTEKTNIVHQFFDEDGIQRILVYFSTQQQLGVDDALTNIIITLMTSKIQLKMNKNGVFLFNNALFIYPFNEMTEKQIASLEALLLRTDDALKNLPPCLYDDMPSIYGFSVTEHMGGSHTVNFKIPDTFQISKISILQAVARATFISPHNQYSTALRRHCFSVIIQRIMSLNTINREIIVRVNEYVEHIIATHGVLAPNVDMMIAETTTSCKTQSE
jgi:hypothetical protein